MPRAAKRFEMVATLSSAARIPLPGATMASAVAARSWSLMSVPISRYCHGSGSVGSDISEECEYLHAASPSGQISYLATGLATTGWPGSVFLPGAREVAPRAVGRHRSESHAPTTSTDSERSYIMQMDTMQPAKSSGTFKIGGDMPVVRLSGQAHKFAN